MASLVLGPLLRHVGERDATVWVETNGACDVTVRANAAVGRSRTFTVAGHHYAIVVVTGLQPGTATAYEVLLDDRVVWPEPLSEFPPSRIRTIDPTRPIRLLIGSCREPPNVGPARRLLDPDIFDAYGYRMAALPEADWPDILMLVGDQVYADETSSKVQEFIKARRDITRPPKAEVANFEEYTRLYYESWGVPVARWFLSTVPSSMMFDDHDIRDDWNASATWRRDMRRKPWWDERITGGLMSYWIYQHLGNLSPAALATDDTYARVCADDDAEATLREVARAADAEADGGPGRMWSYRRDFGSVRVLVLDSRCGRVLTEGRRSMISDETFAWMREQVSGGGFRHLVVATSMPWLLPRALHDLESWNEALCAGSRGRLLAGVSERIRRAVDLEHWAAFRLSFDRLAAWFTALGRGEHGGDPPSTITVVSGDVHHTYLSEAELRAPVASRVFQITCSPIHNTIPFPMRVVFHLGWSRKLEAIFGRLARWARVPPVPIHWHHPSGPHFGNMLARLELDGQDARVLLERAVWGDAGVDGERKPRIDITAELSLTDAAPPG